VPHKVLLSRDLKKSSFCRSQFLGKFDLRKTYVAGGLRQESNSIQCQAEEGLELFEDFATATIPKTSGPISEIPQPETQQMMKASVEKAVGLLARKTGLRKLENLNFDNVTLRSLPIDPTTDNFIRQVRGANFSRVSPDPVKNPVLVCASPEALELLDLDPTEIARPDFAEHMSGNKLIPGAETAAHCYCGFQFGYFSGQLGDGAAMYLGEVVNRRGERWEFQFKGAGLTPYSRSADGRKVLRSSIREFLCSEAMHFLGIPTTRGGAVVTSDSKVVRDVFYSGNPIQERCSIVTRIAPTFIRFGSFEIFRPVDPNTGREGPSVGLEDEMLPTMIEHTIKTYYPHIWERQDLPIQQRYLAFYREIVERTARLVADWQAVGWCHGVLNTDNMSIVGVTLDYGPFGFLDAYDPNHICNGSDDQGRYSYQNQPSICKWNCQKLAEALEYVLPLELSEAALDSAFDSAFNAHYMGKMRAKLGLARTDVEGDEKLVESLLQAMDTTRADWTNTWRNLNRIPVPASDEDLAQVPAEQLELLLSKTASIEELEATACKRQPPQQLRMLFQLARRSPQILPSLGIDPDAVIQQMNLWEANNRSSFGSPMEREASNLATWSEWLKSYRKRLRMEAEGCASAEDLAALNRRRVELMNETNPKFILRNWIAEEAIKKAEAADFSMVWDVLDLLRNPFSEGREGKPDDQYYASRPPSWAQKLCVTCSS